MNTGAHKADRDTTQEPLVSVVMPVYNCADYLEQCLDSVFGQTYTNFEVICIDDGSTDNSRALLDEYAKTCDNLIIIGQENAGPAKARNVGIARAKGDYLLCVDSDDFIDEQLMEKAVGRAEALQADIVTWDIWFYNNQHKRVQHPPLGILHFAPFDKDKEVFSYKDNPDHILLSFQNWPWNKLFRMAFVKEHNLVFQEDIKRTEDALFVCAALVKAERIATLGERLSYYRVMRSDSAMATKDQHAFDFYQAHVRLKYYLEEEGLYDEVERSYLTWALSSSLYNLRTLTSYEAFCEVYDFLKTTGFEQMGIGAQSADAYLDEMLHAELGVMRSLDASQYLFYRVQHVGRMEEDACAVMDFISMDLTGELEGARAVVASLEQEKRHLQADVVRLEAEKIEERKELLSTAEYRVGDVLCRIPRKVQRALAKKSDEPSC